MKSWLPPTIEVAIRCKHDTDKSEGITYRDEDDASSTIKMIDERLEWLTKLFRQKYTMSDKGKSGFNPVKNPSHRDDLGDLPSKTLVLEIKELIDKYRRFSKFSWYIVTH